MRRKRTRPVWLWPLLATLALLLPSLTVGFAPAAKAQDGTPPNIVLVLLDDLDVHSLGRMRQTRALLEAEGTRFSNFFVADPICCPSRASILRGQYVHNHGVKHVFAPEGGFPTFRNAGLERDTIATRLNDVGYRTALIGKYLNEYPRTVSPTYIPPGWDEWMGWIKGHYFDYEQNVNGRVVTRGDEAKDYATDVESRYANAWVAAVAKSDQPFFLHLSPRAPHNPPTPAPRYAERTNGIEERAPRVPSFNEPDVSDKPGWVQRWPRMSGRRAAQLDQRHVARQRTLLAADDMVGSLVATLKASGAYDNTYVFFTSDNGYGLGQHRIEGKGTPYEESIRVPLLVVGPDVKKNADVAQLGLNTDLAPTFAHLAGLDPIPFADGRSLAPLLRGEAPQPWREAALVEYYQPGSDFPSPSAAVDAGDGSDVRAAAAPPGFTPAPTWKALRTADRVYVEYATGERELYALKGDADHKADPYQLENLAQNPTPVQEAELAEFAAWLGALRDCRGQGCRAAEQAPPVNDAQVRAAEDGQVVGAARDEATGSGDRAGDGGREPPARARKGSRPAEDRTAGQRAASTASADGADQVDDDRANGKASDGRRDEDDRSDLRNDRDDRPAPPDATAGATEPPDR